MTVVVTINVTQEHIDKGSPGSPSYCPLSLAARETFNVSYICVNFSEIHRGLSQNDIYYALTTDAMREFIRVFDSHNPVKPTSFEVESLVGLTS